MQICTKEKTPNDNQKNINNFINPLTAKPKNTLVKNVYLKSPTTSRMVSEHCNSVKCRKCTQGTNILAT